MDNQVGLWTAIKDFPLQFWSIVAPAIGLVIATGLWFFAQVPG